MTQFTILIDLGYVFKLEVIIANLIFSKKKTKIQKKKVYDILDYDVIIKQGEKKKVS